MHGARWWILGVFSVFTMWQCSVWNTWGPLAETAKQVSQLAAQLLRLSPMFPLLQTFHWTDGTLVLFNLWGILAFPVFVPLSSYLLSTSLRASVLLASACLFLGSTVRCRTKRKP